MATLVSPPAAATLVIVPGLRDHVESHWQTHLARQWPGARAVPAMGRENLSCQARVAAIDAALNAVRGPVVLVAHSGGCLAVLHWAQASRLTHQVQAAFLATPADFDQPMPEGYPIQAALLAGGWMPVPRQRLPFRSVVAVSDNDPLCARDQAVALARDWGSDTVFLGNVGHLNPASGFGPWPEAARWVERLLVAPA